MVGNLLQALDSCAVQITGVYHQPPQSLFLETNDPFRFLEDKLRLSALADWDFLEGIFWVIYQLSPAKSFPFLVEEPC